MSEHEEFVSSLAKQASIKSGLIESRVLGGDGKEVRVFVSTSGRIGASLDGSGAHFRRKLGVMGELSITWPALRTVESVRKHWKRHRDTWALFETSSNGFPPGFGIGYRVQAPGAISEYGLIGSNVMGHFRGKRFTGREVEREPSRQWQAQGIGVVAELWRTGEEQTPPEGWTIGLKYKLDDGYWAVARRSKLEVFYGKNIVTFEAFDENVVPLLIQIGIESGYVK